MRRRFAWRYWILLALAAFVLADVFVLRGPLHRWVTALSSNIDHRSYLIVARVGDENIMLPDLEEAMRDHLWRRGEDWAVLSVAAQRQTRAAVMERLVNERLISRCRLQEAVAARASVPKSGAAESLADSATAAGIEMAMFRKQFEQEDDFVMRLGLRQLTEPRLSGRMQRALDDEAWLESKIAARMEPVTQSDVSEWLRENRASMAIPPSYGVAHIYLTTHDAKQPDREAEMREIHRKLVAGEGTFEQLALQHSDDERSKKTGGDLGWCVRGRMPDDFMNAVEKLEEGQTSEPVETKLGWHVIRLIDKKPGRAPTLGEVKTEVMALLRAARRASAIESLIAELRTQSSASIVLHQPRIDTAGPRR